MSSIKNGRLHLGEDLAFETWGNQAMIGTRDFDTQLTLEDIGTLSEWLAEAYENIAGEPYAPKVYSDGGYIEDPGNEVLFEAIEIGKRLGREEDAVELAHAAILMASDPGPGAASYGQEHVLERDCE